MDSHPSDIVLRCLDPGGREVVARQGRWESHIEDGPPEVDRHVGAVLEAIRNPVPITSDATHANRENVYGRVALPPPYDRLYLKVCVEDDPGNVSGTIALGVAITAYPTKRIGRGEAERWP